MVYQLAIGLCWWCRGLEFARLVLPVSHAQHLSLSSLTQHSEGKATVLQGPMMTKLRFGQTHARCAGLHMSPCLQLVPVHLAENCVQGAVLCRNRALVEMVKH